MPATYTPHAAQGIARSLRIYHRDAERIARMDALNAQLCQPGGLVFDIGAHVGDRVASFRRLGARVVAVEPQPAAMRALRLLFSRDADVTLVPMAIGPAPAAEGRVLELHLNSANPTITTASSAFIAATRGALGWEGQVWDRVIEVPMTSLDDLVAQHGVPDFVKIDVEGFEAEAIAGLSHPVPALSFEFTTIQRDAALMALARVDRLGDYRFNVSIGEDHVLSMGAWVDAAAMATYLHDVPEAVNSGDVYARLV